MINNICKLDVIATVYKANQTQSNNKNQAVCGKMNAIENLTKSQENVKDKEYNYTIRENCECPQLRKVNNMFSNAVVLAPKKNVNGKTVKLDENTWVLSDTLDVRHEIYNMARQCNQKDLEDF